MEFDQPIDALIIGAGPAGLTTGIFASNKNLRVLILEGLIAGGQLKNLYPHKPVYNYPGYAQISAGELAELMLQQVQAKQVPVLENEPVEKIVPLPNRSLQVQTPSKQIEAQSVVLACGMGLFQPNRLNVPGEADLENDGIYYVISDPRCWSEQDVAVLGGGNSAVDNALLLTEKKCHITLIHKLLKFQAEPASVEQLKRREAEIYMGWKTKEFTVSDSGKVVIGIENTQTGEQRKLKKDRVLINIGIKPRLEFLQQLDVEKKGRQILVDSEMRTSISGIFGCGDVVNYPGKVRLIVTALGEAATALNSVERYLKTLKK